MQSMILLAFGGALVRLACSDALLRYVRPGTRPFVLGAGLAIVALAGGCLVLREGAPGAAPGSRAVAFVLAPVVAVVVVAPPALGALTASRRPAAPPRPHGVLGPLPASDPVPIALADIVVRSIWDHGRTLRGHELRTVGFVSRRGATGFIVTRLVITCCAADAEPNSIEVDAHGAAPPLNAWVEVTGRFTGMSDAGRFVPRLVASDVRPVSAPANPYG